MSREKKILLLACAAVMVVVIFAICILAVTQDKTPPAAPTQQIQGVEGIDWEDCLNNEPDCIFGRRNLRPTTGAKKTSAPATTKKTTTTRTGGR